MGNFKSKLGRYSVNIPQLIIRCILLWVILLFLVLPNLNLLGRVFFNEGKFTTDTFTKVRKSEIAMNSLKNSFILAFASIIVVNITGILIVLFTDYFDIKGAKILELGYMSTLVYGGITLVTGWKFTYGEHGCFTNMLVHFFPQMNREWFIGFWPVLFIMAFSATSNHMMFLSNSIRSLDYHTIEAAKNMGASPFRILWKIVIPSVLPTIFAITILTFLGGLGAMSGPQVVGGDFQTVNPMIMTFASLTRSRNIAALLAIILGLATAGLLVITNKIEKKGNFVSVSNTKARLVKQKINNPVLNIIMHIIAYLMFVIYMLPVLNVIVYSFTDGLTVVTGIIRKDSFTIANYLKLFKSSTALKPFIVSTVYSILAAIIVTMICIFVARYVTRPKYAIDKIFEPLILIPWLLPSSMIALGLMMYFDEPRIALFNKVLVATPAILLVAYVIVKIPFSFRMIRASYLSLDISVEEAAQVMGARPMYVLRRIIIPTILPAVLSVTVLNFNSLLSEYNMTVFLYHPSYQPLGITIKSATNEVATTDEQSMTYVYTVVLMVISTITLWLGRYDGFGKIVDKIRKIKKGNNNENIN